jgi:hypothetical protein
MILGGKEYWMGLIIESAWVFSQSLEFTAK